MSLAWAGYRALLPLAGAAAPLGRWLAPSRERRLWNERLGRLPGGEPADAWIHAASLGEAVAVSGLIAELRVTAPGARFRLTATTVTGRERLAALGEPVALAPLDTPAAVGRFLGAVRPRRLLLLETELWPQWLLGARAAGTPVAVLSARLSSGSLRRYRWLGPDFVRLVAGLGAVLCQSDPDRERWLGLGARPERTATVGNLKNDGLPAPAVDRGAARRDLGLDPARPLLVLGSLRPGEGRALAAAWGSLPLETRRRWQVVAVPRHANASAGIEREARAAGTEIVKQGEPREGAWRWDDRAGVLRGYFAAAEVAFVGGTLGAYGGHNPLEPAACGAAVLVGPHLDAQGPAVATLRQAGALEVAEHAESLSARLAGLLEDTARRERASAAGLAAAAAARGATRRAVARLAEWGLWP